MNAARYTDSAEELEEKIMRDLERKIMDAVEGPTMEDERRKAKDVAESRAASSADLRPEPCMTLLKDRANGLVCALRFILYDQIKAPPGVKADDSGGPPPRHEELDERLVQQIEELLLVIAEADKLTRLIEARVGHLQNIVL